MEEKIIAARRIARTRSSALNNRSSGWGAGVCFQKGVGLPVSRGWARPPPEFISTEFWLVVICRAPDSAVACSSTTSQSTVKHVTNPCGWGSDLAHAARGGDQGS